MNYEQLSNRAREENVLSSVLLELTYGCNLDCTFCYNDLNLRGRRVSLELYRSVLDELADMNVMSLTLSGGEPLLYKHFWEVGAHARKKGFVIKVKSNGVPLNRRNAQRLKAEVDPFMVEMSLHGARPQTHDRLTQVEGSFERLIRNIDILQTLNLRLKLNAALTCWNEDEVADMFALSDRIGVPLQFDPEITPRDDGDLSPLEIAPGKAGIENMVRLSMLRSRVKQDADTLPIKMKLGKMKSGKMKSASSADIKIDPGRHKVCGAGSTNLTIDPFGNVFPCVQLRRNAGNIHKQSISEIWSGSSELKTVRDLAGQALLVARKQGLKQFCMGVNEIRTGDALKSPHSKLEIDQVYQRVDWELNS